MPKANAQKELGIFSEPSYLSLGDPYDPPKESHGRHRGLNMMTSSVKRGNVPKYVLFDKAYKRVSEGDPYQPPGGGERRARKDGWNRCLTSNGFTFSSPTKRRTGLGDITGNFSKFPSWEARDGASKKTKDDIPAMPRSNIMSSPTKKGGYGIPGTTLSKGSEYRYMADPYGRAREMEQAEKKMIADKTAAMTGGKPFQTMSHARDCFDKTVFTDPENLRGGYKGCLLYTSDAADEEDSVDLGGRRIIKKKKKKKKRKN
eukprot:TRINITY_DN5507_c0_g1_i2.p1 TRINITY_DN5507_c0_g1~~TRINITY_DN5507_c0_g1_i2.p1  ORF type:complete len:259 (-),score=67.37 TRINITY_DN5507_c0_g1_i2:79-855(-)